MNALLLFSYASLKSLDDVQPFYEHIFRGPVSEEKLASSIDTFRSLGTPDPLGTHTYRIGKALTERLQTLTNETWHYYIGNKHIYPFVDDAVKQCVRDGANTITTLALTPFFSASGLQQYERQVLKTLKEIGASHVTLNNEAPFYQNERFVKLMQERLHDALHWLPERERQNAEVIFTAHSMPGTERAHQTFVEQYTHLAGVLAKGANVSRYHIAYRSASSGAKRWLGPDILDTIKQLAERGVKAIVVSDLLSVIANSEAIRELGYEARIQAYELGMSFVQTDYLNDSYEFVMALANHIINTSPTGHEHNH